MPVHGRRAVFLSDASTLVPIDWVRTLDSSRAWKHGALVLIAERLPPIVLPRGASALSQPCTFASYHSCPFHVSIASVTSSCGVHGRSLQALACHASLYS